MNEVLLEVLNNESYTSNEDRAKAIQTALATLVIPKDKFNEQSKRLQNVEAEKGTLQSSFNELENKYNDLRKQNMSAEEKQKEELEQLKKDKEMVARQLSEIAVERILYNNGVNSNTYGEDEYKNLVNDLIGENVDSSTTKANNFIKILNKQKEFVEKETTSNLLKNTPRPNAGSEDDKPITKEDFNKMTYSEMMKFSKENPELYTEYMKD